MYAAVHSDRSGRVFVSADYAAAVFDGASVIPMAAALALPAGAELVPLPEREAIAFDRRGRGRGLGTTRWAIGAVLPQGALRVALPAYSQATSAGALAPRPYAAVGADESGSLVVAAIRVDRHTPPAPIDEGHLATRVNDALRAHPSNLALRHLARCARQQGCAKARESFSGGERILPVSSERNDAPPEGVALGPERCRGDGPVFRASARDLAELALAHLRDGTGEVTFGGACDGEPLLAVRLLSEAVARVRDEWPAARLVLRSNASVGPALARACSAGVGALRMRLVSARPETYEWFHGPIGYRWTDVLASLRIAGEAGADITIEALVLPGLFDRAAETDALIALLGSLPAGTVLRLADLSADPERAAGPRRGPERPEGVAAAVARIAGQLPTLRIASAIS
ncbi:MAG: hypothetical protein M3O91_01670 [Chloroflexota bacterium]|nr:hypothetical protein [Chloroflexota bacterium]